MQTLRVEVREQSKGPGVQFSIPMPPVGKPIPQAIVIGTERYAYKEVLPSGSIPALWKATGNLPAMTRIVITHQDAKK